jgi:hypothetical protein
MQKPQMPNMPGVGSVTDTLDFVKNLWGSMGVPGMNMPGITSPTLSLDDLEKKIADLKAVEAWLNVNVSMLRGTIQALEIQRGTIATLKSMGATLAQAVKQPGADEKSVLAAAPFASAFFGQPAAPNAEPQAAETAPAAPAEASPFMPNPALWWNVLQDQFKQAVTNAMSSEAMSNASTMAQEAAARMSGAAGAKPGQDAEPAAAPATPRTPKPKADKT